jgi:hypothetical protein
MEEEVTAVLLIATGTEFTRKIQRTQNDNEVRAFFTSPVPPSRLQPKCCIN